MRAVRFDTNETASVIEIPVPTPGASEVLVRVTSTGVCGSDLAALTGKHIFRKPPLISGHEAGGIVESIGNNVSDFKPGDRVVIDPQRSCFDCDTCESGNYHLCNQKVMLGVAEWDGSFSEFVLVPVNTLIKAPDEIPDRYLALAEPIAVACHAVRQAAARKAETALVLGGGTIGALITRVLSDNGSEVTVSEPRKQLQEKLQALGASAVFTPDELPIKKYDQVFVAADHPILLKTAVESVTKGGAITQVAVFNEEVPVHVGKIQVNEVALFGTAMYQKQDFTRALELLEKYKDIPEIIVTHETSLEDGVGYINKMAQHGPGDVLKLVMIP